MVYMDEESFSQQELFQQEKYISDLIEKKSEKPKSSINIMVASSLVSSAIVLSFLYLFGLFDADEIVIPEPVTITETVTAITHKYSWRGWAGRFLFFSCVGLRVAGGRQLAGRAAAGCRLGDAGRRLQGRKIGR